MTQADPKASRPRIEMESSNIEVVCGMIAWAGVAASILTVVYYWPSLPTYVPQHFDARGEVTDIGPRWALIWLVSLPVVMVAGLGFLKRFPHKFNYLWEITEENAERQYRYSIELLAVMRASISWMFFAIAWVICQLAIGNTTGLASLFLPLGLGPIFAGIAWYFVRALKGR